MMSTAMAAAMAAGSVPAWAEGEAAAPVKDTARVESVSEDTAEVDPKDIQNKLLKLTTLESAFKRALQKRNLLRRFIAVENGKLEEATTDDAKAEARKNIGNARKQLNTLQIAMDVVFGTGNRREYEYNEVDSTIFLKVGTVEEAFARSVRTRDALSAFIVEKRKAAEAEADAEAKEKLEKKIAEAVRQYQTVAAALQVIYQVTPTRNYEYNPKDSTLYLKISENELQNLREQVRKLQEKAASETETKDAE